MPSRLLEYPARIVGLDALWHVDRYGNIWILDSFLNVLWKLKPNGERIMTVGTCGEVANWNDAKWNGMFNQPMDVAFDEDDNFYVVQGHGGTSSPPDCTYCSSYNVAKPPVTQGPIRGCSRSTRPESISRAVHFRMLTAHIPRFTA